MMKIPEVGVSEKLSITDVSKMNNKVFKARI
jgi:hypothetical protein